MCVMGSMILQISFIQNILCSNYDVWNNVAPKLQIVLSSGATTFSRITSMRLSLHSVNTGSDLDCGDS